MTSLTAGSTTPRKKGWYARNEIKVTPWLFLLPGILFFAVYVIAPIFQSFWLFEFYNDFGFWVVFSGEHAQHASLSAFDKWNFS